jgi:hypothetical protein
MQTDAEAEQGIGERAVRELRRLVARYGAGEAEVARTYFERRRTAAHDRVWLTSQVGRELSRVYQLSAAATRELTALGAGGDRYEYAETVQKLAEELNHFNLLGDILVEIGGAPLDYAELRRYDFFEPDPEAPFNRENARLAEVNRRIDAEMAERRPPWAALVQDQGLLEGGGNGVFYVGSQLRGSPLDERLAAAMQRILDDEMDHGPRSLAEVPRYIQSEDDLSGVIGYTRLRGDQRLRWRNEQFGYPLGSERLAAIMAGEIEPLPLYALDDDGGSQER